MQRPVSITRALPRGGGFDFNSQNKHEHKKDRQTFNHEIFTIEFFYLKLKKREFLQLIGGNILVVRVGCAGGSQVRYQNSQLDVLNPTMYHT